MKPVIGIIGGIGSGKSAVAAELVRRGGALVAGDPLGHEGLRQPDLKRQVIDRWGERVLNPDGEINRRCLAGIVFNDRVELRALEAILFPYIGQRIREQIAGAMSDPKVQFVVLDAAVLLEAGWRNACDYVIFVDAPRDIRLRRLVQSRGWTDAELAARERLQLPLDEKIRSANAVIDNSGRIEELPRQLNKILEKWIPLLPPASIE